MKHYAGIISAAFLIFYNCAPSIAINKKWSPTNGGNKSLAIIIPEEKIEVNYSGNVENEFGKGDKVTLIRSNIRELFKKRISLKTCFKNARLDVVASGLEKQNIVITKLSDGLELPVPMPNTEITLADSQADYLLYFEKVKISTSVMLNGNIGMPSYSKMMYMHVKFYIWDMREKCLIVSGYTSNQDDNGLYTDMNNWINIVDRTINEMFEKSLFLQYPDLKPEDTVRPAKNY